MYVPAFSPRFISALGSPRSVAGAAERLRHALLRARQDVAAGAHSAPHDHGLARELVVDGNEGVVRGKRAGGALAVNQQCLEVAVHDVLLHLGRGGREGGRVRVRVITHEIGRIDEQVSDGRAGCSGQPRPTMAKRLV